MMQPAARKPATKKRSSTDGADQLGHSAGSAAGAKRVRRDSHTAASKGGAVAEEEEDQSSMMKQAKDRPVELELNKFEPGSLIEVQLTPNAEWTLASIRGSSDKLYTVQIEPADQPPARGAAALLRPLPQGAHAVAAAAGLPPGDPDGHADRRRQDPAAPVQHMP